MISVLAIKFTKQDGYYWSDELQLFSPDYIKLFYNEVDAKTYLENHPYLKDFGKIVPMTLRENVCSTAVPQWTYTFKLNY